MGWYTATYVKNDPHFKRFEAMMEEFGGRPHWGKIGAPHRAKATAMYSRFGEFAKIPSADGPGWSVCERLHPESLWALT